MQKFVFITFIPGSAGHFISNCLNLLTGFHAWVEKSTGTMPVDTMEKLKVLGYESVLNFNKTSETQVSWHDKIEAKLAYYAEHKRHNDIGKNDVGVSIAHFYSKHLSNRKSMLTANDVFFDFFIDPEDVLDWTLSNLIHKNTNAERSAHVQLTKECLDQFYNDYSRIDNPIAINLKNIITGWDTFFIEFKNMCNIIGYTILPIEKTALEIMYNQWKTTTVESYST